MAFIRSGSCNLCGECCGYPRSTDGGQNNAWANDFPESIRNWDAESLATSLPIFQFSNDMLNTPNGDFTVQGNRCRWIWIQNHGWCTDLPPYGDTSTYDQRCPCLSSKLGDGTVPCRLYGTRYEYIWHQLCEPVPPMRLDTQAQVDAWFSNCPSCSYVYTAE